MECRICKQPISFVKGTRAGQKRKVTVAVHANEVPQAVADMQGEVVTPHPGSQRKLRMELEHGWPDMAVAYTSLRPDSSDA